MRPAWGVLLGLVWLAGLGCSRGEKHQVDFRTEFSKNVVPTPLWFPGEIETSPAERSVLRKRGAPDYLRYWWNPDGSLVTSSDLRSLDLEERKRKLTVMRKSWIYTRDNEEVIFTPDGGEYKIQPISEVIRLICRYGDPSIKNEPVYHDGVRRETWLWIDHGLKVVLEDGKVVEQESFSPTGAGTFIAK